MKLKLILPLVIVAVLIAGFLLLKKYNTCSVVSAWPNLRGNTTTCTCYGFEIGASNQTAVDGNYITSCIGVKK